MNRIKNLFGISQKIGVRIMMKVNELIQFRGRLIEDLGSKTENRFDIIIFTCKSLFCNCEFWFEMMLFYKWRDLRIKFYFWS